MSARSFPGPWRVELTEGGHFVVKDATGLSIGYVYARNDEALRSSHITHAEAVVMAEQIARLPELAKGRKVKLTHAQCLQHSQAYFDAVRTAK
jgi:hypothetical protein